MESCDFNSLYCGSTLKDRFVFVQRHEREIQQKLEEQEETALNITETYNSLQQEVEIKTKKLKKVNKLFYDSIHKY